MNFFQPVAARIANWTSLPVFIFSMMIFIGLPLGMFYWMHRRSWV